MIQPIAFGSSSTGDLSGFARLLSPQSESVSVTVDDGINLKDTSSFRVLHQIEPPEVLDCVSKIIDNHRFYDLILCWNEDILKVCPNARLFPQAVCTWMEHCYLPWADMQVPKQMECDETKKQFKASFLTSSKGWTSGHKFRQEILKNLPEQVGQIRIEKFTSPPWIPDKRAILDEYQFTITPQNASLNNWFDDKIIDSLVAKTIPLFWGCPNIGNFFNMDGVIHFKTYDELISNLSALTPDYYQQHYAAVKDNFERAMKYVHIWSRMDKEITEGIERRNKGGWRHEDAVRAPVQVQTIQRRLRKPYKCE